VGHDEIGIVLFDLGGVLIDVGGVGPMRTLARIDSDEELWRRWLTCPWVRRFERGQCSPEDFAAGMVVEWGLDVPVDTYLAAFQNWMSGPLPGAEVLLEDARRQLPLGCLSNINSLHWGQLAARATIFDAFTYRFLSFELGLVKPDNELFEHIGTRLPIPRHRVLFLDDNMLNVDAALAAGFTARHVRGIDETRRALVATGVLER
jgi:putative hydrolase of the HAD superfamily